MKLVVFLLPHVLQHIVVTQLSPAACSVPITLIGLNISAGQSLDNGLKSAFWVVVMV